jgi:3-hydroxyacyl-[acyl-carrier-protein] dehydratase
VSLGDPITLGLPHREPFIFVDKVLAHAPGETAECAKTFAPETPFFAGHFPGDPIVPGVILAEALAQTAGIAAGQSGKRFHLSALRMMKFPAPARPAEEVRLHARKAGVVGGLWQFECRAVVGDRVVAEGVIVLSEVG